MSQTMRYFVYYVGKNWVCEKTFQAILFHRILLKPQSNIPTCIHENANKFVSCVTYRCIVHAELLWFRDRHCDQCVHCINTSNYVGHV